MPRPYEAVLLYFVRQIRSVVRIQPYQPSTVSKRRCGRDPPSAFRRRFLQVMLDLLALGEEDGVFADVRRQVGDALEVA